MSFISILANDKNVILYRKELNAATGSVTATLLLQQLIYWAEKNDFKPFYKFIEPCSHKAYKESDSWCEELGFSKKEFTTAYKKLEALEIVSKSIDMTRLTTYTVNKENLDKLLNGIYESNERELTKVTKGNLVYNDTETTTETTTDIKKSKPKKEQIFRDLLQDIQTSCRYKAKAQFTQKAFDLFKNGDFDSEEVKENYIAHQEKEGNYAKTIANFLLDYETIVEDMQKPTNSTSYKPKEVYVPQGLEELLERDQQPIGDIFDVEVLG